MYHNIGVVFNWCTNYSIHENILVILVSTKHLSKEPKDNSNIPEPPYKIICEPSCGPVEYLVIEITLPKVVRKLYGV